MEELARLIDIDDAALRRLLDDVPVGIGIPGHDILMRCVVDFAAGVRRDFAVRPARTNNGSFRRGTKVGFQTSSQKIFDLTELLAR